MTVAGATFFFMERPVRLHRRRRDVDRLRAVAHRIETRPSRGLQIATALAPVAGVVGDDEVVPIVVHDVARQDDLPATRLPRLRHASPLDDQWFALSFEGGTIAAALNALVRAHGGAMWDAGVILNPSPTAHNADSLMVTIRTFNACEKCAGQGGFTVATPVARLRAIAVQ